MTEDKIIERLQKLVITTVDETDKDFWDEIQPALDNATDHVIDVDKAIKQLITDIKTK